MFNKVRTFLQGKKTYILMGLGSTLIVLIQLGVIDAANYDRLINLAMMLGLVTVHSAVMRK